MVRQLKLAFVVVIVLIACGQFVGSNGMAAAQKARQVVPVTNVVQSGAQPIKGKVVEVEVIDAVDIVRSQGPTKLKIAVRIRNARKAEVKCSLKLSFDGESMGQPWSVHLPPGQSDLTIFACYCGDGKGADQLGRLTAEASNIRIDP